LRWRSTELLFDAGAVHFNELGGKRTCRPIPHFFPLLEPAEPAMPELYTVSMQIARMVVEAVLGVPEPVAFDSCLPAIGAKLPAVKAQSHMFPVNLAPCLKLLEPVPVDVYSEARV